MSKQTNPEFSQRKLKLAEAGVLFVLIMGLMIAVGVKMTGDEPEPTTVATAEPAAPAIVVEPEHDTAAIAQAVIAAAEAEQEAEEIVPEPVEPAPVERYAATASPSAIYTDGEAAYFARDYDEAADIFAVYTERTPHNAWGHYMHGLSLWKAGDAEAAAGSLESALSAKPDHVKSLVNLARVQLELDRPEDALGSVEQALALAPESADAFRVLGRVYHELDRRHEAVDAYLSGLALRGDDAWSLNNLGLIYLELEREQEAVAPLAKAVALAPERTVFLNNLGMALERTGSTDQAAETYARAVDGGGSAKAEVSLARVEARLDDGADLGETLDLAALAATFEARPRYAAESGGDKGVADHAPGLATSAADSVAATGAEPATVALSGER